ncbi:MAG: tyrosine-type recombinase/integrase [Anaerovoracaceae bacterium]
MKLYLRGDTWHVTHWTGEKQIRMSTGCTDRAEAEKKAKTLLAPIITQTDDEIRVATASAIIDKLARERKNTVAEQLRLADCWKRYPHSSPRKELKPSTIDGARIAWDNFVGYCRGNNVLTIDDVTPAIARAFLAAKRPRWRVICYIYCKAMFKRVGLTNNPFDGLRPESPGPTHREPLTIEQIHSLLGETDRLAGQKNSAPDAAEFALFIRFLIYTGLRLGDAATALISQIDYRAGTIERMMAKTSRPVKFPLHPAILPLLPKDGEYLFPSMNTLYNGSKIKGQALTRRIKRLFDMAKISGLPAQYCAHCLRTTFASICAENQIPLPVIQSWLGHTSQEVTRIYARIEDMRVKRAALAKFPKL